MLHEFDVEVSERMPAGDHVTLTFVSTFLDTILICAYSKGTPRYQFVPA
jgi:hypothetical protein